VSTPQVIPGIVDTLFQPLTVEALLSGGEATGPTVRYITEGTATCGAAGVAEGGLKPESTLGFVSADESVRKVATTLIASDEILDDVPAVQRFVNGRLQLFVAIETERQLLRGTSGGNEIQGLLTSRGVPVYSGGTAVGNRAEQVFRAMNGVRGSAYTEPDWLVVNPTDWQEIRLLTDDNGGYLGGGPFGSQYGGVSVGVNGQVSGALDLLWGKPVHVTSALGAGTALIGTRAAAAVYRRGPATVEMTNSHGDLFTSDMVAIRCERRAALCVFRPGAFCEVRLS
jgi:HK97 family phage major capsid protein